MSLRHDFWYVLSCAKITVRFEYVCLLKLCCKITILECEIIININLMDFCVDERKVVASDVDILRTILNPFFLILVLHIMQNSTVYYKKNHNNFIIYSLLFTFSLLFEIQIYLCATKETTNMGFPANKEVLLCECKSILPTAQQVLAILLGLVTGVGRVPSSSLEGVPHPVPIPCLGVSPVGQMEVPPPCLASWGTPPISQMAVLPVRKDGVTPPPFG